MSAELLFRQDEYLKNDTARVLDATSEGVRLTRTLFYPTGGGQPGDTGIMRWQSGEARIINTTKYRRQGEADDILHVLAEGSPLPPIGSDVEMILDWERRYAHMRMHSCLQLLSSLLKDAAVTGGQVGAEKSRLDFDIPSGQIDKTHLTLELNRLIKEDHPVSERWITDEELDAQPELVRTMSVKPPRGQGFVRLLAIGDGIDLQPCGGTHIKRTSEIGPVEVSKIENKGKQNRRITIIFMAP